MILSVPLKYTCVMKVTAKSIFQYTKRRHGTRLFNHFPMTLLTTAFFLSFVIGSGAGFTHFLAKHIARKNTFEAYGKRLVPAEWQNPFMFTGILLCSPKQRPLNLLSKMLRQGTVKFKSAYTIPISATIIKVENKEGNENCWQWWYHVLNIAITGRRYVGITTWYRKPRRLIMVCFFALCHQQKQCLVNFLGPAIRYLNPIGYRTPSHNTAHSTKVISRKSFAYIMALNKWEVAILTD